MSNITNKLLEEIENNIKVDINELGFEIEYIEYVNELNNNIFRVALDKLEGIIDIEDCEKVSRKIEDKIDNLMKQDKEYILEVTSAGLERQLKNLKLYKKYIGREICFKLFKKTDILKDVKLKEFDAILVNVDEVKNFVKLKTKISNIDITFDLDIKDIASAHTTFDFKSCLKASKK
ncbi:MAG: hypothetical protein RR290_00870 [Clostridia bacterium]